MNKGDRNVIKRPFNEELRIGENLYWSMLKYGLCSYFALVYAKKYALTKKTFLAIMEYDEELEKEYLVHILIKSDDNLIDAYGSYNNWQDSVKDITDIEFMELRTKEVSKEFILKTIEDDMGFDQKLYDTILDFVKKTY